MESHLGMRNRTLRIPATAAAVAEAINHAAAGEIVLLEQGGHVVAAVVPLEVAAAGVDALSAAEDVADRLLGKRLIAELDAGMATMRLSDLRREIAL
ncbi:hypothetical protein [Nonomuraea basaltis]|uniref:hypothetical protein n=1 Tax=Nonomuraea basaltis TaxID=2495887 RepID=UPI00110C463C|nr:hypothetical protein [Nonomuraea basaltis]TMR92599.1 hypothetical protein EJK15_43770 [Nonomuraea basaltis]